MNTPANGTTAIAVDAASADAMARTQRKAELLAKQSAREAAREKEIADQELEMLELLEKYETELGARGRMFELIDARSLGQGFIVAKRPSPTDEKKFEAAIEKARERKRPVDESEFATYVAPNIVHCGKASGDTARNAYMLVAGDLPRLHERIARAMRVMCGMKKSEDEGEF